MRNALLCDELSLEALHIAELHAHTTPAECDGCLSWRLAAGGASAPRAVARSDEAVCNGTTATLYVVAAPAAERGSGEPASGEAEEEHGSGDGDGERARAYTQGSEARVALPARDDGGAVVAHLACNGERFFMALPLHALWAEHDARVAAEVLQPHIDPITEIVAVIDRDLVGNDLAIDTIHPAMRLHGMTSSSPSPSPSSPSAPPSTSCGARAAAARPSSAAPSCRRSSERAACSEAATRAAGSAAPAARAARRSCGRAVGARAAPRWSICACDWAGLVLASRLAGGAFSDAVSEAPSDVFFVHTSRSHLVGHVLAEGVARSPCMRVNFSRFPAL